MVSNKGKLHVAAPYEVTDLRVLNASRQEVAAGVHELQVELDPGIYLVEATIPGDRTERYIAVEPNGTISLDDLHLQFDSSTPLLNVRSAHDIHRKSAERHSKNVDVALGGDSANARLFLFARTKGDARQVRPTFTLYSQSGRVTFPEVGTFSLTEGWIALTVDLPAGTHMLEQEVPDIGKRCQVIFVEEGWETQVFAPWEAFPDFARSTIYMRRLGAGFNPSMYWEYQHTEAVVDWP